MGTHNICLYKEVDKNYTGCNLKTMKLLDCALIGVCVVIRLNTVFIYCCSQMMPANARQKKTFFMQFCFNNLFSHSGLNFHFTKIIMLNFQ